ncbi:MAG: nucleotidyl transferase AbiEii/AbiGii toxin family protein [Sphingobacteriales bacterium]|nr:nucleotidyl transferase AbiEii/AbiGii toxin family protein [Sphingobacteriales bacterium]MBI3717218.1 nucleotidyl transferase AbiEii/AbiGii toxin family protein [Sphingobacteriales bacterium]
MLHLNTISEPVRHLLLSFSASEQLQNFALAGGTALALHLGHRKSIDIDLFAFNQTDMYETSLYLENSFNQIDVRKTSNAFIFCFINNIKCDFVNHSRHLLIKPILTLDNIRLFSKEDIAAMKLNAICGRGSKKDFYDIFSLLKIFSLKEMLSFYDYKFKSDNSWMALRSLQFYEDTDMQEQPELITEFPKWEEIKSHIYNEVNNYNFNA